MYNFFKNSEMSVINIMKRYGNKSGIVKNGNCQYVINVTLSTPGIVSASNYLIDELI